MEESVAAQIGSACRAHLTKEEQAIVLRAINERSSEMADLMVPLGGTVVTYEECARQMLALSRKVLGLE